MHGGSFRHEVASRAPVVSDDVMDPYLWKDEAMEKQGLDACSITTTIYHEEDNSKIVACPK